MALEDMIATNRTKQLFNHLDTLKATGDELLSAMSAAAIHHFPDHFTSTPTDSRLEFSLFGLQLLARVELAVHEEEQSRVRTFVVRPGSPPLLQDLEMDFAFDVLGNVNRSMTMDEAGPKFVPALMKQLATQKIFLHS